MKNKIKTKHFSYLFCSITKFIHVNFMYTIQVVPLIETISTSKARGQVEKWLLELEGIMVSSIHKVSSVSSEPKIFP